MKKIIQLIVVTYLLISNSVFAENALECSKTTVRNSGVNVPVIACLIRTNEIQFQKFNINRGNCIIEAEYAKVSPYTKNNKTLVDALNKNTYERIYKFGETIQLPVIGTDGAPCNVIEAEISTTKGAWQFKW